MTAPPPPSRTTSLTTISPFLTRLRPRLGERSRMAPPDGDLDAAGDLVAGGGLEAGARGFAGSGVPTIAGVALIPLDVA